MRGKKHFVFSLFGFLGAVLFLLSGCSIFIQPPDPVDKVDPWNGDTGIAIPVTFDWNPTTGEGEITYFLYLDTNPNPTTLRTPEGTTDTEWEVDGLEPATQYYWFVKARNKGGASSSTVWTFITQGNLPAAPTLSQPGNGSSISVDSVNLQWNAPTSGATPITYDVYMDKNPEPTTKIAGDLGVLNFQVDGLTSGTYYWKVVAKNEFGEEGSTIFSLVVNVVVPVPPTAPTLSSPAQGAVLAQGNATLRWTASTGSTPIVYDVYLDQNPAPVTLAQADVGGLQIDVTGLTEGVYYWKVIATNSVGSAASAVGSFTVQFPANPAVISLEKVGDRSFRIIASEAFDLETNITIGFDSSIPLEWSHFTPRGWSGGLANPQVSGSPGVAQVVYTNVAADLSGSALSLGTSDLVIASATFAEVPDGTVELLSFFNGAESLTIGANDSVTFSPPTGEGVYLEKLPGNDGFVIKVESPIVIGSVVSMKMTSTLNPGLQSNEFDPNGMISGIVANPIISLPDVVYNNNAADLGGEVLFTGGSDLVVATVYFASPKTGSILLTEFVNDGTVVPISSQNETLYF